jgi:putative transposase
VTQSEENLIRDRISSLISPQLIRRRARVQGVLKRRRKVDIVALVYTLVFGFAGAARRSIAGFRRAYGAATRTTLVPSAFYSRFTPELAELMRSLVLHAFQELSAKPAKWCKALAAFKDVFITDGSLIRLDDALQSDYPSVWTNHTKASVKLHVVASGAQRVPIELRLAPGATHDSRLLSIGPWCKGSLCLFDLAYFDGHIFRSIVEAGGDFVCRVRADANWTVIAANDPAMVGRKTQDLLAELGGRSFEVVVDHVFRNARERDFRQQHILLRMIARWHAEARRHRVYVTSSDSIAADAVAAIYAMRWEIELLFRELKSQLRINHMPSRNKVVVECLIYAALLMLAVGRWLRHSLQPRDGNFPIERWTILMRQCAQELLALLLASANLRRVMGARLLLLLRAEGPDPNRRRLSLVQRAQQGTLA